MDQAIHVSQCSRTFGRGRRAHRALDRVDVDIAPGEMVALIGASGSGKSTLMRQIAGLDRSDADGGSIRINGRLVQDREGISSDIRRVRRRIGFIFQQFNLVGRLSLLRNVLVGMVATLPTWRSLTYWYRRPEQEAAMAALHRVGISTYAGQRASTLSGGQQQRAAIARALVQKAEVILGDEPIASLDPESSRQVMETLARINREDGVTVLVSLHQVEIACAYCPRVIALRRGRKVFDGPSGELTPDLLREIYGSELGAALPVQEPSRVRPVPVPGALQPA